MQPITTPINVRINVGRFTETKGGQKLNIVTDFFSSETKSNINIDKNDRDLETNTIQHTV